MARTNRFRLLAGVAFAACAIIGLESKAAAQSICTYGSGIFNCDDGDVATPDATGSYSAAYPGVPGYGTLVFMADNAINIFISGGQLSADDSGYAVYAYSWGGDVAFASDGTVANSNGPGIALNGLSVAAQTGIVSSTGVSALGVFTVSTNGSSNLTATSTIVDGQGAWGIVNRAFGGDAITNTGMISATGTASFGAYTQSISSDGSCGTAQVNVTGNVSGENYGVALSGCGNTFAHVQVGQSVTTSGTYGETLGNGSNGVATTVIDGTVTSFGGAVALAVAADTSETVIGAQGRLNGRFESYSIGADHIEIQAGGVWSMNGTSDFGAENDLVSNAGTLIASGIGSLMSLETFSNSGSINMANGAVGDALSLPGDYIGSGNASVHVDAIDTGADQLIVGGYASGTTSLFVNTRMLIPDPVLVVDTAGSDAGAYVLGNTSATDLIDLNLTQIGDDYFITALPSATALETMMIGRFGRSLWYESADSYWTQRFSRRRRDRPTPFRFWVDGGSHANGDPDSQFDPDNRVSMSRRNGLKVGVDYLIADDVIIGLTGGYGNPQFSGRSGPVALVTQGSAFGAFAQFGGRTGLYGGVLAKTGHYKVQMVHSAFAEADGDPDTHSTGVEAEAGFRTTILGKGVEVGGGLAYLATKTGNFTVDGIKFDFGRNTSVRGRFGVRGELDSRLGLYVDAQVYHEFAGDEELTLASGSETLSLDRNGRSTSARFEAGFGSGTDAGSTFLAWADVEDKLSIGLRASIRL